jgi:hypothetical protein
MAARRPKPVHNRLGTFMVANCVIAAVILAGIGMTYAWLSWQRKERGDANYALSNGIKQLQSQRQALQFRMKARLDSTELRQRVEGMALGLIDIPSGRLVKVDPGAPPSARQ